ncbi:PD-(D/E)XK nuclease family protein [Pareuzebyella sediminis]|uniref:PD-(D/E)XK nuclease family protein n=1 Tax=Pareuzebyella sediminis TaxID=2607998 RepID=UPI0011EE7199|nr:PD-(D/E)XK nuclease family protein [Pareuzebyella sediminis]
MQNFLEEVVKEVWPKYGSLEDIIFILPSKRAGVFLKRAIANNTHRTIFLPEIFSIEHFIEKISGISYANSTQQLFNLYQAYVDTNSTEAESFFKFSKWSLTLLHDFNEIDRYLVSASQLFSNLAAIQEINHWSFQSKKTKMMENYLEFWNSLEVLYHRFNTLLLDQGLGHQGLVYRKACEEIDTYLKNFKGKTFIFAGFNALNTAESQIFQHILSTCSAEIYWDIDRYFLDDDIHDAGYFIRQHRRDWHYLQEYGLKGPSSNYTKRKKIELIGIPKNVSQAKFTGEILANIQKQQPETLKSTAIILGDEALLNPLLNAVPESISSINITMGYPLAKSQLATFFELYVELYTSKPQNGWYFQAILHILSHPYIHLLLKDSDENTISNIEEAIKKKNWVYVTADQLKELATDNEMASLLFMESTPTPKKFITTCLRLIERLKLKFQEGSDDLGLEHLYRFYGLFNQLLNIIDRYTFITDLRSFQSLYSELLATETLDFQGEPIEGLQIMGMLESRNLDFETVIITSVNEGILPSGKSNNSFIPLDIKRNIGLPTYKEKDAIYTYHFYRLLQRAKNIYILYNTEPDVLEGGEPSRLINQLLTDEKRQGDIIHYVASPSIEPSKNVLRSINKDAGLVDLIRKHASNGFSPSSLSNYIRAPLDFYKLNLLGIDEKEEVEETVAANTFGTIVHDTLEELYSPFLGQYLTEKGLLEVKTNIKDLVRHHFTKNYLDGDISKGKNLIAYNVVARYVEHFIDLEIDEVSKQRIKILALEKNLRIPLSIPEVDFPIFLKGKLDRIDEVDGTLRIIDYKTGAVERRHVEIVDWSEIAINYDYSKAFQLLCYSLMYNFDHPTDKIEAGIFSFKKLSSGLLKFATKEKKGNSSKQTSITADTLKFFEVELNRLIREICNPEIPIQEKES